MRRLFIPALLAFGCAGPGSDSAMGPMAPGTGTVQSSLTGAQGAGKVHPQVMGGGMSNLGVTQIIVTVSKVTAHSTTAGWVTLSSTEVTVDILKLAQFAQPLGFANMPAGHITQVRLYVKDGGTQYVVRDDGTQVDLKVPSGVQSGIKLKGEFDVVGCNLTNVQMEWDGKHSIWVHPDGQGDEWLLRPVIRIGDVTGTDVGCMSGSGSGGGPGGVTEGGNPMMNPGLGGGSSTGNGGSGGNGGSSTGSGGNGGSSTGTGSGGSTGNGGSGGSFTEMSPGGTVPPTLGTLPPGAACSTGSMCLSNVCTAQGTCGKSGAGEPCSVGSDCMSGTCGADATCAPGSAVGTGAACTVNTDCLSNNCVSGVCGAGAQGAPCTVDADCGSGFTCTLGSCTPMIN
jgi:hypothetical protein